eukprot:CAMPEP_0196755522 /NCGR_PEP_ID=MMETSP1091-20130531/97822_1 /TAXON_ID=302021 /ORGANISM="Rhodomonas sp., Strain CCMP768" /LENGTH=91 /DNA_ID=CAMNT_0042103951 /DNA_START=84 /DNA_END=355 /DNA_ORIENTATION=+
MSRWYQLLQGEKWAATGTVFKPKEGSSGAKPGAPLENAAAQLPSVAENITADRVHVQVWDEFGQPSACSLQHFLEVTGADRVYSLAVAEAG